ncbi:MAG: pseudaminic acid cytidylyltransferase [Bdellovibrionota bacterium]|nr:pseudaminic acid cytidylyltransferase [Bdellovibrionota bacterium]
MKSNSKIAIILGRANSKRLPNKNLIEFEGNPILHYPIKAAIESKLFDRVIVSSDSPEIAKLAIDLGAEAPFLRTEEVSNDEASTYAALHYSLDQLSQNYEYFCCIYASSPLIQSKRISEAYHRFTSEDADFCYPICKFSSPPQRAFIKKINQIQMPGQKHLWSRSQDLEPYYFDIGEFYWGKVSSLEKYKAIYGGKIIGYEVSELESQDINTKTDLELAKLKFKLRASNSTSL